MKYIELCSGLRIFFKQFKNKHIFANIANIFSRINKANEQRRIKSGFKRGFFMKAIVLCGGKGTRLRPYTHSIPKPMLRLGRKPLLEYIIDYLQREGVVEVVLAVGHLKEQIIDYFGNGSKHGIKISYSEEEGELGTAGSVKKALSKISGEDDVLVLMGDQLTNLKLKELMKFHKSKNAFITIALKQSGIPLQYGTAELGSQGEITAFKEKPTIQSLINVGFYVLNKKALEYLPEKGDFAMDVFPKLLAGRHKIAGFVFDDYWVDVGSIHDYENVNRMVSMIDLIVSSKK